MAGFPSLLLRAVDLILLLPFFLLLSLVIPLIDAQTCLHLHPQSLVDLKAWYIREYGDYLMAEKPHFFVGLVWAEIGLLWPLCVASSYAILARKSWLPTTCLMVGFSTATSMAAIMAELLGSGRASTKLYLMYGPGVFFSVSTLLRGFLPCSSSGEKTTSVGMARAARKKRA